MPGAVLSRARGASAPDDPRLRALLLQAQLGPGSERGRASDYLMGPRMANGGAPVVHHRGEAANRQARSSRGGRRAAPELGGALEGGVLVSATET